MNNRIVMFLLSLCQFASLAAQEGANKAIQNEAQVVKPIATVFEPGAIDVRNPLLIDEVRRRSGLDPVVDPADRAAFHRTFNAIQNIRVIHSLGSEWLESVMSQLHVPTPKIRLLLDRSEERARADRARLSEFIHFLRAKQVQEQLREFEINYAAIIQKDELEFSKELFAILPHHERLVFSRQLHEKWQARAIHHPFVQLVLDLNKEQIDKLAKMFQELGVLVSSGFKDMNENPRAATGGFSPRIQKQIENLYYSTLRTLTEKQLAAWFFIDGKCAVPSSLRDSIKNIPISARNELARNLPIVKEVLE